MRVNRIASWVIYIHIYIKNCLLYFLCSYFSSLVFFPLACLLAYLLCLVSHRVLFFHVCVLLWRFSMIWKFILFTKCAGLKVILISFVWLHGKTIFGHFNFVLLSFHYRLGAVFFSCYFHRQFQTINEVAPRQYAILIKPTFTHIFAVVKSSPTYFNVALRFPRMFFFFCKWSDFDSFA